jgi:hypothetical protein
MQDHLGVGPINTIPPSQLHSLSILGLLQSVISTQIALNGSDPGPDSDGSHEWSDDGERTKDGLWTRLRPNRLTFLR